MTTEHRNIRLTALEQSLGQMHQQIKQLSKVVLYQKVKIEALTNLCRDHLDIKDDTPLDPVASTSDD